jgi:hypothetical protein
VEYSNEVWNGMFPQSKYAGEQGITLGFAEKLWEAAWRYTAYRSVQIFKIWEEVLGRARLVLVLPSQAANPYVSERIVEFQDAYRRADALAIAPYTSCNVAPQGKRSAADAEKWTVEQALDYMEQTAQPESIRWIKDQKRVADKYGLRLVAYEGGQHMVGIGGAENNDTITKLLHTANRHPRIGAIYQKCYDAWTAEGGDLFCYFASTGSWSKWGSWGIIEWFDEDTVKAEVHGHDAMGEAVRAESKRPAIIVRSTLIEKRTQPGKRPDLCGRGVQTWSLVLVRSSCGSPSVWRWLAARMPRRKARSTTALSRTLGRAAVSPKAGRWRATRPWFRN